MAAEDLVRVLLQLNRPGEALEVAELAHEKRQQVLPLILCHVAAGRVMESERAIEVNIAVMRTFVRLRKMLASHTGLARKIAALERKYDEQFAVVFDAIRALMTEPETPRRQIGFKAKEGRAAYKGRRKGK